MNNTSIPASTDLPAEPSDSSPAVTSSIVVAAQNISQTVQAPEGALTILKNIDFSLSSGESMAVLGASGSGKSTLLGLLAGLDLPSKGHVQLLDHDLSQLDEDQRASLRRGHIGFVFQSFQLLPGLNALENVMLPLEMMGSPEAENKATRLLTEVGLEHRMKHYPSQLSGGEQQRVAIARAFVCDPKIVFADEPTGNLDQKTGQKIIDLIFKLQETHDLTLLLVTHDPKLAARCQHRIYLEAGEMIKEESNHSPSGEETAP